MREKWFYIFVLHIYENIESFFELVNKLSSLEQANISLRQKRYDPLPKNFKLVYKLRFFFVNEKYIYMCIIKICYQNVSSKCLTKMSHQNVSSKCPIKCLIKMSQ